MAAPRERDIDARDPRRTCIGCRQVRPQHALVRLGRRADGIVVVAERAAGRGAYVCPDDRCVGRAAAAAVLSRAFRKRCEAGVDLAREVREFWQRQRSR
jgi:predicted RNA-binding protein YlxR (DUF448 family)